MDVIAEANPKASIKSSANDCCAELLVIWPSAGCSYANSIPRKCETYPMKSTLLIVESKSSNFSSTSSLILK